MTLQHSFPTDFEVKALVDVRLLLAKLTAEQTSVGQWVNIIGYIASPPPAHIEPPSKRKMEASTVHVQALMLWSAGPLDIGRYERSLAGVVEEQEPQERRHKSRPT